MPFRPLAAVLLAMPVVALVAAEPAKPPAGLRFVVKIASKQVGAKPESGRVLVGVAKAKEIPDFTNYRPPVLPILGADAEAFTADKTVILDATSDVFPLTPLDALPAGCRARRCAKCHRAMRPGQWAVRDRLASNDFADTVRYIHINPCLRDLVGQAPDIDDAAPTTTEQLLDQLRREHRRTVTRRTAA